MKYQSAGGGHDFAADNSFRDYEGLVGKAPRLLNYVIQSGNVTLEPNFNYPQWNVYRNAGSGNCLFARG